MLISRIAALARAGRIDRLNARGATLIEYVLLMAFVTLVCIGAMQVVGTRLSERFSRVASVMEVAP